MRIAVSSAGNTLESPVDPRFGRCRYFLIIDTGTLAFEAVENPNISLGGGAGIQSAQLVADKGVQYLLTGNCGPNAFQTLTAAGIGVITGCSGVVSDLVKQFNAGEFQTSPGANVPDHFGASSGVADSPMGPGMGMGPGRGMGGGRGGGRGMGMGGGSGRGRRMGRGTGPGTGRRNK
ncbi:MAG: NifB/NifX family molybdenum-iron cluster-binding protein [Deltaproteobacteria bacterium]|jgi:predicted Fe-Mo cluster-binding NifX family protein|nr:NifB/NifX family molybdenum-iron cluster-binding protein [Deltaproteobacteria bacterium]MDX9761297.1 NifB/NifX family molybdenum-iron cluster-binding protein [Desulfomonilia bacterium]